MNIHDFQRGQIPSCPGQGHLASWVPVGVQRGAKDQEKKNQSEGLERLRGRFPGLKSPKNVIICKYF